MSKALVCTTLLLASGILLDGIGAADALAGNAGRSAPAVSAAGTAPAPCRGMTTGTPAYAACVAAQQQQAQQQQQQQKNQGAQSQ